MSARPMLTMLSTRAGRRLVTMAALAACLFASASIAAAQGDVAPSPTKPPATSRGTRLGIQGIAIVGVTWPAATKSLKATGLTTKPVEIGGGAQVTNIWRDLFAQVSASRFSETGERAFVDDSKNTFPLGIPLTVKTTYLDVSAGWKFASSDPGSNLLSYVGGGVGRVTYKESSPFAQAGDNLDSDTTSYHVLVGAEVKVLQWLSVSGDLRYRWVPDLLGAGGVSAAFNEKDFGGFHVGAGIRVGFGGPRLRKAPSDDDAAPPSPTESRDPARITSRASASGSATIVGSAPVYLRPDEKLEPLRVLEPGTSVKVLQENDEWIRIQFSDRVLGPRVGYVLKRHLQLPK